MNSSRLSLSLVLFAAFPVVQRSSYFNVVNSHFVIYFVLNSRRALPIFLEVYFMF